MFERDDLTQARAEWEAQKQEGFGFWGNLRNELGFRLSKLGARLLLRQLVRPRVVGPRTLEAAAAERNLIAHLRSTLECRNPIEAGDRALALAEESASAS